MQKYGFYKGINLGGWFSQCDYSDERLDNFITEPDFEKVASWGADHVRIPVDYNVTPSSSVQHTHLVDWALVSATQKKS